MRIGVVIAGHKMVPKLERCLGGFVSLLAGASNLIFVDNGSKENIKKWVEEKFPKITAIRLGENRLFCGGYNAGIRIAMERGYDFVLIVNADTEVINPGFIKDLIESAERWPMAAFIGPLVYLRSPEVIQETCLQFPGIIRNASIWVFSRILPKRYFDQPKKESRVEVLNGVCVLCRVRALKEIDLMDENMGGYAEDYDWAWRARKRGWASVFSPVPSVVHHEERSGYELYSLKRFLGKRNVVYWFLKIGRHHSARCYAKASLGLAMARLFLSRSSAERRKHAYFFRRLRRAFRGLLCREAIGEWFGPPFGSWENDHDL